MEPGTLLFSLLSQDPGINALLGTRIYPVVAPQDAPRPYVTYLLVDRVPEPGSSAACRLGDVARVQLSLFSVNTTDYGMIAKLTTAIRAVLDYAQPESGVYLEIDNQQDHHDERAACLFRSLDYTVELH